MSISDLTRQQKLNLLFIAFLIIALIIGIFVVRQRQEIRKKAAIETPLQLILNPQTTTVIPGPAILPTIQIENTSGAQYAISGLEATLTVGNQLTIFTSGIDCLTPFNGLKSITTDTNTNTITVLCTIAADQAPYIIQGSEKKDAVRLSFVPKSSPLGQAQLVFTRTRVTQAGAAGSMQAVNLSSGGITGIYTVANPTPTGGPTTTTAPTATGIANRLPDCSGGITITGKTPVAGKYLVTKGETVQLVANNITDPDGDAYDLITGTTFRFKSIATPTGSQCPTSGDGSQILGNNQRGSNDAGLTVNWYQTWDTTNVVVGDYWVWANPSDGPNSYCSGNPFYSPTNTCGAPAECTNCEGRVLISVVATGTPIPTNPITPLPTEPITPPGGNDRLNFLLWAPDILQSVTSIPANKVQVIIYGGAIPIVTINPVLDPNRNGNYFSVGVRTTLPASFPQTTQYTVLVKLGNTIQRVFRNVTLTKGQLADCTGTSVGSCGELVSQRDIKTFISGDSDGFDRNSFSFNKIDVNDYDNYLRERFGGVNNLLTDFNGDGQVNVSDLAIWAKNYFVNGDATP
ncbi:hypothetical protein HYT02_00165 [Candidatus Gottesmanbacteria bacterium]|nr:hypothetical protein [Candidatus Gottesmanbacteria bacterium]